MNIAPVLLIIVVFGYASLARSQSTQPSELEPLIAKLGAEDWKVREAAQQQIVAMGEVAEPRMKEVAAKSTDPEVRQRAADILRQIAAGNVTRASLVTLHFKDAPAREVYESLYAQANAKLVTWPSEGLFENDAKDPITIDLEKAPFWQAINELEEQTGLGVGDFGTEMALSDARHGMGKGAVYISGPFMVVIDDWGDGMIHRLKVFVEPRIRLLGHAGEADIVEVLDARGKAIPIAAPRFGRDVDDLGGNAFDVHINGLEEHRVKKLKGSVRAVVLAREAKVEIDDIAKANNVEKQVNGRRFILNTMNPAPNDWNVTVVAYNTVPPTLGLHQLRAGLVDAKGNALLNGGQGSRGSDKRVDFNMAFKQGPNCGPPARLIMEFPSETREIKIPFEFGEAELGPKKRPVRVQPN